MQREHRARRSGLLTGGASIVVGVAVMSLWLARPHALAATAPLAFAMQFNTALCFVLSGSAVCLLLAGASRASLALAGLATLFAAAMLTQHIFAIDLHIDQMLLQPFITTGPNPPGRMAANAALCFVLINSAIMLSALLGRTSTARIVLAALVFTIATSALLGYLLSISTAHDWLPMVRMSPQTALCFFCLSAGLIFIDIERLGYHPPVVAAVLAAATYLLLLVITYVEMMRQEVLFNQELPAGEQSNARSTLLAVLLLSGAVYACLIVYAFRSAEKSRKMAAQLAESQKRLAAIIDTAADGFITFDQRGAILSANPACDRLFGYPAEEMIRQNIRTLLPPSSDQQVPAMMTMDEFVGTGREMDALRQDGARFAADLSVTRIDLGHQVIYSGIIRDMSERKAYERDILDANAELEEFSYRTSHDLRSPIASSLGLMSVIEDMIRQGADLADIRPVLARIDQSIRKLDHLIQNIIVLTRTKVMDEPEIPIPVARAVHETIERLRQAGGGRASTVHVDIPETMILRRKASRFHIIVDNLLSNALKFHDPAESAPEIFVHAASVKGRFVLSVADNGLGIPPGTEQQLFQMFKRFHPQHAPGSGLGLYILRKSAEHLGGTVAYRRQEKGSIFTVTLPEETIR